MAELFQDPLFESLLPEENLSVKTDQIDYAPGSTATFTVTGLGEGETVQFDLVETVAGDDGVLNTYAPFIVTDGGTGDLDGLANGEIVTTWLVPADPDGDDPQVASALNATLQLTATAAGADGAIGTTDDRVATTTFTDGSPAITLNQWETKTNQWANGQANPNQATYLEGDVVPFSVEASNLTVGTTYGIRINLNTYQSNTDAGGFLYLDTYNRSITSLPNNFSNTGSLGTLTADNSFTFSDPSYANPSLQFYVANADVLSITYGLSLNGLDRYADVTFKANTANENDGEATAEIYWGQRLALPNEVITTANTGGSFGASRFTGGSLQTKIEGTGAGGATWITPSNAVQLQPGVVLQGAISGYKWNDLDGQGDKDANEPGLAGWTINLYKDNGNNIFDTGDTLVTTRITSDGTTDANGDGSINSADLGFYKFAPVLRGTYFVTETQQSGWTQTFPGNNFLGPLKIDEINPTYTNQNFGNKVTFVPNPNFTIAKDVTSVTGGAGVSADSAGDIINYNIVLTNTGNQNLTDVTLSDPFATSVSSTHTDTGLGTHGDNILDVGETWTYTASHIVTQAELDAGATLVNVATADTAQTDPKSDDATTPVIQNKVLHIEKDATVPGGTANVVGEVISYTMAVTNLGNAAISNVVVNDAFTSDEAPVLSGGFNTGDTDKDGKLDVGETWQYTASHAVTQAELDAGGNIVNTATVTGDGATPDDDDASVPVAQNPQIAINKVTVYGTQSGDGLTGVIAGKPISWNYTVTNPGNVSLSSVTVKDNAGTAATGDDFFATPILSGGFNTGDTNKDGKLNPGESWTFTASGTAVAGSYSNIGTASGTTTGGTPVTKTDLSSYFGTADVAQIAPTNTTPQQYINGTAPDFSNFYASQGGVIQYGTNKGKINQTNPGVFFYYTGLSNTIKGVDADNDGKADSIKVLIDQSNPNGTVWNFGTTFNDVKLYKVIDTNLSKTIDAGETAVQVQLKANEVSFTDNKGDVTISFTPDAVNSLYIIGVKYDTSTVVGLPEGSRPTVNYTFSTDVGGNGTIEETDTKGITLAYKGALTLDGTPTVGGATLTQDKLAPIVNAAIDYWAAQGVDAQGLNQLKQTDVLIGDLGGTSLGETLGSPDGLIVKIDDDADGYGWSTSIDSVNPNQVDLLSTLTHEFGHILGLDHDDMGEALGVGERHLPLADDNLDLLKQQYSSVFAVQTQV